MLQNLSSAAVVIGTLRVNILVKKYHVLNYAVICIKALVQSKKNCIPAAFNMKHNNTLFFFLVDA